MGLTLHMDYRKAIHGPLLVKEPVQAFSLRALLIRHEFKILNALWRVRSCGIEETEAWTSA